jgi:hypothetical protein
MSGPRGTTSFTDFSSQVLNDDSPMCLPHQYSCHLLVSYPAMCHRMIGPRGTCTSVPCVTLPVVTCVTSWLVHVNCMKSTNCDAMSVVWSYDLYSQLPCGTIWTVQLAFFLHVWQNEKNVISGAYNIRLSPFKLCWVHINKSYVHVLFEYIPRN